MKVRVMALLWLLASVSVNAGEGERKVFVKRWRSETPRRRPGDLASLVGTGSRLQGGHVSCAPALRHRQRQLRRRALRTVNTTMRQIVPVHSF